MTDVVPARWPFATVTVDAATHPALVVEWKRLADANGYRFWHARCVWFAGGQIHDQLVPATRVRKVTGPASS